jgi:hypothetical protein
VTRSKSTLLVLALTAAVLSLGIFLSWRTAGSEASAAVLAADRAAHFEHLPNGYRHSKGANPHAIFADEGEAGDKLPANAALLTALVLGVFVWTALWWSGMFARTRPRSRVCSPTQNQFHSMLCFIQQRPVATLLAVLRL